MKIIILGAGRVGSSVAESLVSEANDITVIDTDGARVAELQDRYDLRGLVGNATLPSMLKEAGAEDADMLIAVTSTDETNLVACKLAADLFNVPTRIARVRNTELQAHPELTGEQGFRVNHIIWHVRSTPAIPNNPGAQTGGPTNLLLLPDKCTTGLSSSSMVSTGV